MNEKAKKMVKIIRYIGVTSSIVSIICILFVFLTNDSIFEDGKSFYYFSYLPFTFLYIQVWHITRDLDKNLVEVILAHVIGIIYFIFSLFYVF